MAASFDRRRINGPEESRPPVFDDDIEQRVYSLKKTRKGRKPGDVRPICISSSQVLGCWSNTSIAVLTTGLITQANGSAYIETEKTKIACAV